MRTITDLRDALIASEQTPPPLERFLNVIPGPQIRGVDRRG